MASSSTSTSNTSFETRYVERFEGRNFQLWKWRMEMVLKEKGLFNITNGTEPCPVDKTIEFNTLNQNQKLALETHLSKDGKAYNTICLNLGDLPARQIKTAKSANEVWTKLENIYEAKNTTNRLILKKRLSTLHMGNNDNMTDYLDKFRTTLEELEAVGSILEEEDKIATLLNSLPDSFENLVVSLESRGNQIDLDFVMARLLQEEMRRGKRNEENDTLFIAKVNDKETIKNEEVNLTKSGKRLLSKEEMSKVTCYYCNKKGHFANKCYKRINDKKCNEEEVNQTTTESEFLFSASFDSHKDNHWYLDSGATMHMTFKRNLLINIKL